MVRCRMQSLKKDITRRERQMGTNLDALKVRLKPRSADLNACRATAVEWEILPSVETMVPLPDLHRGARVPSACLIVQMSGKKSAACQF